MNLVLFGPPGAGKGTQAQRVCARYRLKHLSTGDAIRSAIREETKIGRLVAELVEHGELVPDDMVTGIVEEFVARNRSQTDSFLFDGYPRTLPQIEQLDSLLEAHRLTPAVVVSLEVPDDDLVRRVTGRRICSECRRVFNIHALDRQAIASCEICHGSPPLIQRKDDTVETLSERLRIYHAQTEPVLHQYEMAGKLATIDGTGDPDEVFERLCGILSEQY
ncbi:MAG: adenylate kinase [Candidatus Sumerlaeia bacterium]|nr:adenylate kinase [Candidatus Sumerlaeia bacterium]